MNLIKSETTAVDSTESMIQQFTRGEAEIQAAIAHRFPRDYNVAKKRIRQMATSDAEIASACFYALPRGEKIIEGPSIRLLEIAAQCWGNIRSSSYVLSVNERTVTARGVCWDLETNLCVYQDRERSIIYKSGGRYNDDMIMITSNAACAIAYREAVIKCIGKIYIDPIWQECRLVAVGEVKSISDHWSKCIAHFAKMGVSAEQILDRLGRESPKQVTASDIATMRGLSTALRDGEIRIDDAFRPVAGDTVKSFGPKKRGRPKGSKNKETKKRKPQGVTGTPAGTETGGIVVTGNHGITPEDDLPVWDENPDIQAHEPDKPSPVNPDQSGFGFGG